jgi:Zn-finger nucleic acid-binding protein
MSEVSNTARHMCPECSVDQVVENLHHVESRELEYFRCLKCGAVWTLPRGEEHPATMVAMARRRSRKP